MNFLDELLASLSNADSPWAQQQMAFMTGASPVPPQLQEVNPHAGPMAPLRPQAAASPGLSPPVAPAAGLSPALARPAAGPSLAPPSAGTYLSGALNGAAQASNPIGALLGMVGGAMNAGNGVEQANKTFQLLVSRGMPPDQAALAVRNPDAMKMALAQVFQKKPAGEWKKIGQDEYGREQYGLIDPVTGRVTPYAAPPMGQPGGFDGIPQGVDPKKYREEMAKNAAESRKNLPGVITSAQTVMTTLDKLESHPAFGRMIGVAKIPGTEFGVPRDLIPNVTEGANEFEALKEQVKGQAFLEAFKSLRGGGQITEAEGKKATEAITTLGNARQGPEAYRRAIAELRAIAERGLENAKRTALGLSPALEQAPAAPQQQPQAAPVIRRFGRIE